MWIEIIYQIMNTGDYDFTESSILPSQVKHITTSMYTTFLKVCLLSLVETFIMHTISHISAKSKHEVLSMK